MRSRFLVCEHDEVDPGATRVLQHGLQHLLQLEDDQPLLVARAPDPAQYDPHVDEVLLDVGDRGRVDQEVVNTVVPHLTAFTKSMLDEVGKEQEEEDQHAGSIYSGSNLCSSAPSLHTIFAKNPFPRELPTFPFSLNVLISPGLYLPLVEWFVGAGIGSAGRLK